MGNLRKSKIWLIFACDGLYMFITNHNVSCCIEFLNKNWIKLGSNICILEALTVEDTNCWENGRATRGQKRLSFQMIGIPRYTWSRAFPRLKYFETLSAPSAKKYTRLMWSDKVKIIINFLPIDFAGWMETGCFPAAVWWGAIVCVEPKPEIYCCNYLCIWFLV